MNDHRSSSVREIDDIQDRMGDIEQLDFSDRREQRQGRAGDALTPAEQAERYPAERVREAGMTGGEAPGATVHEDGVTQDDLSPETLLDESGARGPHESGQGPLPADKELSQVDAASAGLGGDLDEAEAGRRRPLDGKPWRDPQQPLRAEEALDDEQREGLIAEQKLPSDRLAR